MKRIAVIAAALACAAAIASPALAEGNGRTMNVQYSTSDLLTPEGSARVEAEIRTASRNVCSAHELRGVDRLRMESLCRADTEHQALSELSIRVAEARAASRTALAAVN
jgi:UrcA family protein